VRRPKKISYIKKILILCPLKRFASILLIGILFFNWYGYQLLSLYWQQRAESKLEASLDRNDYDESELLSVKIPISNLAYYNGSTSFVRVDGHVDINGVRYNYVQRRLFKDSLELLCIPNTTAMDIQKVKNEFFRQVNDLQQHNQGKKSNSPVKDFSKDYTPTAMDVAVPAALAVLMPVTGTTTTSYLPIRYTPTAERPPDVCPSLG
jgi:hypothetical protein